MAAFSAPHTMGFYARQVLKHFWTLQGFHWIWKEEGTTGVNEDLKAVFFFLTICLQQEDSECLSMTISH